MTEKELKIISCEPKEAKNGRLYHRFKTSEGWMSCFENDVVDKLKEYIGGILTLEVVETDDGFKNIRGVVSSLGAKAKAEKFDEGEQNKRGAGVDDKTICVLTSYVKDLLVARGIKNDMSIDDLVIMMCKIYKQVKSELA